MENKRNYYRILHVQPDAPLEVIKTSYRTLMHKMKNHPDLGGEHWNALLINEAKEVLTNPHKRAEYDRKLQHAYSKSTLTGQQYYNQLDDPQQEPCKSEIPDNEYKSYTCVFCKTPHIISARNLIDTQCAYCGSPLNPPSRGQFEGSGQRNLDRIAYQDDFIFFINWPPEQKHLGTIVDLSINGMKFIANHGLQFEQIIKVVNNKLHATGKVVNCFTIRQQQQTIYSVNLEFLTVKFVRSRGTFVSEKI